MKNTIISTLALSLLMAGCGGGSSSSPKTSSSSSVVSSVAPSSAAASSVATSAVANSQASSLAAVATGVFLDGAVANIGYRTATQQGSTNSNGEFNYRPGESITFFIGNLELPAVLAGAIITPMEIANTNNLSDNQLINIMRLLQSLDADGNAANGIEITAAAIAAGAVLDFTVAPEVFAQLPAVKTLLQASGSSNSELIPAEQAIAHFQTTLEFINGPASSSASSIAVSSSSSSDTVIVVPGSSASSAPVVASSSSVSSIGVVASSSSSSAASEAPIVSSASSASSDASILSSSAPASSAASNSSESESSGLRPAKMEGFAAYAGVTGGAGGTVFTVTTGTELNAALCGARNKNKTAPVIIYVNGTINHGNTTAQGCNTQADVIEIKQTANVSIIGVGTNALFDQIGIHVRDSSNVIIQNVHVRNVKKSGTPTSNGGDAIGLETDVDRVWIDHNWLEASGGESDGYDSLLDMKSGVTNVTVSYNKFNDSSRAGLVGFTDSDVNNNITFHHNWYKNIQQRTPLIRNALVHVYNNYWSNESLTYMYHAINSRANAKALVESNYFYNVNNPLIASDDSDTPGCWQTNNDNTVLPRIYYSRSVGNGALVVPTVVDGQLQSTCAVTVPYTVTMDAANDVPAIVMANAGVGKIGNGSASSSSGNSSATTSSAANSAVSSSSDAGGASSDAGSSTSSSVAASSAASSSSAPSVVIVNTPLPVTEDFNNVVDAAGFFSTAYKALKTEESSFYFANGGAAPSFTNGALTLLGGRFTLANVKPSVTTTASDTVTYGELDLSQAYRISFCLKAVSGTGAFQVSVNNNTTSGSASIHSNSRVYSQAVTNLVANQRVVINSAVGNINSFIQLRTESGTSVTIDDLWIGYQADTTGEPTNESCASSAASSSSVTSSASSSSVASSEGGSEGSSSSASSVASSEVSSSESSSSSSTGGEPQPAIVWTGEALKLSGSTTNISGSVTSTSNTALSFTTTGGKFESAKTALYLVSTPISGDFVMTAKVKQLGTVNESTSSQYPVGLIMCVCNAAESGTKIMALAGLIDKTADSVVNLLPAYGHVLTDGVNYAKNNSASSVTPGDNFFLKLVRSGTGYTSSFSIDGGLNYTVLNSGTFTAALPTTLKVGAFSAAGAANQTFVFENISITQN